MDAARLYESRKPFGRRLQAPLVSPVHRAHHVTWTLSANLNMSRRNWYTES